MERHKSIFLPDVTESFSLDLTFSLDDRSHLEYSTLGALKREINKCSKENEQNGGGSGSWFQNG